MPEGSPPGAIPGNGQQASSSAGLPVVRVLPYLRVSTDEQSRGDYTSVDAQLDLVQAHFRNLSLASGQEYIVPAVFRDEGYSGKDTNRPGLKALRIAVAEGKGDIVAVYKLDRIARSVADFVNLDSEFMTERVGIISIREQLDTTTPLGRAMRVILMAFAQLERETTVQRVMDKFTALVQAGRWGGGSVPYGYRQDGPGLLVPDPETAPTVYRIFEMYADVGLSTNKIAAVLNAEGIPGPKGGKFWESGIVRYILRERCHQGIQRHGKREGPWPFVPLVPQDLVLRALSRLDSNKRRRGANQLRHPWQRLCVCGCCGALLSRKKSVYRGPAGDVSYEYLWCSSRSRRPERNQEKCPLPNIRADWFEKYLEPPLLAAVEKAQPAPPPEPRPDAARLLLEVNERRRRATSSYNARGSLMSDTEYAAILAECDREERALLPPPARADLEQTQNLARAWKKLTLAQKHSALLGLVYRAVFYEDRVVLVLHPTEWEGWPARIGVDRATGAWEVLPAEPAGIASEAA